MAAEFLNPAEAARRLGVSAKALRLYEARGLLAPLRTAAGWRAYGPDDMARAREIAALRALGFSLAQVARVLKGDASGLEPALAAHQTALEVRLAELSGAVEAVRGLRRRLAAGEAPSLAELASLASPGSGLAAAFDLPWPWGGERFEFRDAPALTYVTGPLGSGKTRLCLKLAEAIAGAVFLDLDRKVGGDADPATLAALVADGATDTEALRRLLAGLEQPASAVVADLVEDGLDEPTQEALIAHLRRRGPAARPLILMTRSTAILDLSAVGSDEAILYCPANHSPSMWVRPWPGSPGYEAVATCLAAPDARARTAGMIVVMA
ncbi:MerR family transcriptional regulator [Phenylobacterium sp. J367]|uniref:MerR family transcriptional regulator n=1 Tax=Phenylobacterium sp. J367 TaxID=2898435 RepID=UPI0021514245|nr:MerR family transcriptional regulator [Phenylobacterium sp. J367]MCR5877198.1 MerR family transcriptional regulator [Phenylobacterium sp. J367]